MMSEPDDNAPATAEPLRLTTEERAQFAPVLSRYLEVQRALAEDDQAGASAAAQELVDAVSGLVAPPTASQAWPSLAMELTDHAGRVAASTSIESARAGFEPLSARIEDLLARVGNPLDQPVQVAFCPMANRNHGARWVQSDERIDNAYFGATMRTCGDVVDTVDPGTTLDPGPRRVSPTPHDGHDH